MGFYPSMSFSNNRDILKPKQSLDAKCRGYICETPENSNFLKKGKIVISVKI